MARKPKAGDNKPPVSADTKAECYAEYAELRGEQARVSAKVAAMFHRYESKGIDAREKKAIQHAYAMASKDGAEVAAQHRANTKTLIAVGIIKLADVEWSAHATQAEMELEPSGDAADRLAATQAYWAGYNAARAGGGIEGSERFAPGTDEFVTWRDGWEAGCADRHEIKPETKKEKPADTRRSRKKLAAPAGDDIGQPVGSA